MPANTLHKDYLCHAKKCALVRAIMNNSAQQYIRDVEPGNFPRNQQYRQDAILTNVTKLTCDGLVGLVFRKDPEVMTLPPELDYMLDDATGDNRGLIELSAYVVSELLQTGRLGLLVDYPAKTSSGLLARIKPYTSESIINFRCAHIDDRVVLSLVVLQETQEMIDPDDMFTSVCVPVYRVLYLDTDGIYTQCVYNQANEIISGPIQPTDYNGKTFDTIPFVVLGSKCNNMEWDEIPLLPIAELNLGHYRNSADLEEAGFVCGQPYPVINIGEMNKAEFDAANPGGILFGSRKGLVVANGGSASLLQANPNQLIMAMMQAKLDEMAKLGARLISPPGGRETAEGARIRYGAQNSALYIITVNASEGIETVLEFAALYQNGDPDTIEFELNSQFYDDNADPNLVAQMIQMYDRGLIASQDMLKYGQQTGFIENDRTLDQIQMENGTKPMRVMTQSNMSDMPAQMAVNIDATTTGDNNLEGGY